MDKPSTIYVAGIGNKKPLDFEDFDFTVNGEVNEGIDLKRDVFLAVNRKLREKNENYSGSRFDVIAVKKIKGSSNQYQAVVKFR